MTSEQVEKIRDMFFSNDKEMKELGILAILSLSHKEAVRVLGQSVLPDDFFDIESAYTADKSIRVGKDCAIILYGGLGSIRRPCVIDEYKNYVSKIKYYDK